MCSSDLLFGIALSLLLIASLYWFFAFRHAAEQSQIKQEEALDLLTTKRKVAERRKGASQRRRRDRELSDDMLLDAAIRRNTEYQQSNSSDVTNSLLSVVICPPAHTATSPMPVSVNEACVRLLVGAFMAYSSARRSILAQLTPRWLPSIDSLFS